MARLPFITVLESNINYSKKQFCQVAEYVPSIAVHQDSVFDSLLAIS